MSDLGYNPGDRHIAYIRESLHLLIALDPDDLTGKFWSLEIRVKGTKRFAPKGWTKEKDGRWRGWPVFQRDYASKQGAAKAAKRHLAKYNAVFNGEKP